MNTRHPSIFDTDEIRFAAQAIAASHDRPVLVDFWAAWCAPCLSLAPLLQRAVAEHDGAILLAKVEVDDNMKLAGHYRVRGFPTVIAFRHGQERARFSGHKPLHWLQDFVHDQLALP